MKTADFDYHLPEELIAQHSVEPRDSSRLLVLYKDSGKREHRQFFEIGEYLKEGDVLVVNKTKVFKARLTGKIGDQEAEVFLLRERDGLWEAMIRPGKKVNSGDQIDLDGLSAEVIEKSDIFKLKIDASAEEVLAHTEAHGEVPIPPYVEKNKEAVEQYQTVYAEKTGSVAAPTAGFHFTAELIEKLKGQGIQFEYITLHVGIGTFRPVKSEHLEEHEMHAEFVEIDEGTAERINSAKEEGRRIFAVGTTTVRALEGVAGSLDGSTAGSCHGSPRQSVLGQGPAGPPSGSPIHATRPIRAFTGDVNLFITPGFEFKVIDGLITNFHLPKSTLIVLVSALAGREHVLDAYKEAVEKGYRFYSFGDAMLIT